MLSNMPLFSMNAGVVVSAISCYSVFLNFSHKSHIFTWLQPTPIKLFSFFHTVTPQQYHQDQNKFGHLWGSLYLTDLLPMGKYLICYDSLTLTIHKLAFVLSSWIQKPSHRLFLKF